jgi:RNA polymerase sigma-70 factor (ECF subfamily)
MSDARTLNAAISRLHRWLRRQAIDALRPLDKAVVMLSDLEDLSQRKTSEILGLSVAAVKARLHWARLVLRGRLAASLGGASP